MSPTDDQIRPLKKGADWRRQINWKSWEGFDEHYSREHGPDPGVPRGSILVFLGLFVVQVDVFGDLPLLPIRDGFYECLRGFKHLLPQWQRCSAVERISPP